MIGNSSTKKLNSVWKVFHHIILETVTKIIIEFTSKRNEIKVETESEHGKFERKRRQLQRLMDAEQTKIDSLEVKQMQLFEER